MTKDEIDELIQNGRLADDIPPGVLAATFFTKENKRGGRLEIYGTSDCSGEGGHYWMPNLGSYLPKWAGVISSGEAAGNCRQFTLFEEQNFGGASLICGPACASLGVMNNQTIGFHLEG